MCAKQEGVAQAPIRAKWSPRIIIKDPMVDCHPRFSDSCDWMAVGIMVTASIVISVGFSLPDAIQCTAPSYAEGLWAWMLA